MKNLEIGQKVTVRHPFGHIPKLTCYGVYRHNKLICSDCIKGNPCQYQAEGTETIKIGCLSLKNDTTLVVNLIHEGLVELTEQKGDFIWVMPISDIEYLLPMRDFDDIIFVDVIAAAF